MRKTILWTLLAMIVLGGFAAWWLKRPEPPDTRYSGAYSLDDGLTWLGNIALTPEFNHSLGYPNQQKIGDYYDMVSDDTGASVAFAATFTGGQDVYYMRITAVPEPAAAGLMFAGAAIAYLRRRVPRQHR